MGKKQLRRRGLAVSVYLSQRADELLSRVAQSTRRSRSEIVCLLVETYGPQLLGEKGEIPGA